MKAYVIPNEHARGLDAIELADMPTPVPTPGHVLIKVHAVGLNPVDYKLAEGGNENWTYPHILGLDVAGEIVEIGEGVEDTWKVGMRVAGHGDLRFDGCFAEYVNAPAYELALIPDDVEYTTAAGLLCSALTAYQTINRKPNLNLVRTALVHGGVRRGRRRGGAAREDAWHHRVHHMLDAQRRLCARTRAPGRHHRLPHARRR